MPRLFSTILVLYALGCTGAPRGSLKSRLAAAEAAEKDAIEGGGGGVAESAGASASNSSDQKLRGSLKRRLEAAMKASDGA